MDAVLREADGVDVEVGDPDELDVGLVADVGPWVELNNHVSVCWISFAAIAHIKPCLSLEEFAAVFHEIPLCNILHHIFKLSAEPVVPVALPHCIVFLDVHSAEMGFAWVGKDDRAGLGQDCELVVTVVKIHCRGLGRFFELVGK